MGQFLMKITALPRSVLNENQQKDVEATISSPHAWFMIAHIRRILRKINQVTF